MRKLWTEEDFHDHGTPREFVYRKKEWVVALATLSGDMTILHPCPDADTSSVWYNMDKIYSGPCLFCDKYVPDEVMTMYRLLTL